MKALQYMAPGKPELVDISMPEPGDGEALVRIEAVNTCPHWDMHLMKGEQMLPGMELTYPYSVGQPGHEATGIVEKVGVGVDGLAPGMRVAAWKDPGHSRPGCYAQYNVFDADHLLQISDSLTTEQVASLELAMCVQVCFDRLILNNFVSNSRFAVSGMGPAGMVAAQMARAYGAAETVAIEPVEERQHAARSLGFDQVFSPGAPEVEAIKRSDTQAFGAAIDCTGLKKSIEFLMDRTIHGVSIFGVLREDVVFASRHWSQLNLMGYEPHNRQSAERALKLIEEGKLDLTPLVSKKLPLTRYAEGIDMLFEKKAIKICYLPWENS